jgi:multicomponent Na+:H+ antiporter subunit B
VNGVLLVDVILLTLVAVTGIAVIQVRSLFSATMLAGLYSLLMALVWTNMHALDVAFTEAAVGAGISTVLLLGAVAHAGRLSMGDARRHGSALFICLLTGGALVYGTLDMPHFGDPDAPIHQLRVPKLQSQTVGKDPSKPPMEGQAQHAEEGEHEEHEESGGHAHPDDDFKGHVPNTVTSLLAAYRGYDTMFETAVIFTAGASLVLLLRVRRREDDLPLIREDKSDGKEDA